MEVVIAKHSGFCTGVKHAVDTVMSLDPRNTYVLGEIIHNPDVVNAIEKRGIKTVGNIEEVPDGATVVFRSHGVPENYYGACRAKNVKIVDCTCAFVRRTQNIVKEQYALGKHIIIVGENAHPEVLGLLGWCGGQATVVNSPDANFTVFSQKELCVVCQTTFSAQKF